jgi:hypothetical protein
MKAAKISAAKWRHNINIEENIKVWRKPENRNGGRGKMAWRNEMKPLAYQLAWREIEENRKWREMSK